VQLSADRVTFTVQSEISINEGSFSACADASAEGAESQWLTKFKAYLSQNNNAGQRRRSGPAETLPAVQALYRSSALPNSLPSMRKQLGAVSNGLVGACLTAFTEVNYACFFSSCCVMPLSQHKRLLLRPDDIFLPLLDAAATHVFQNGEQSRNVFVGHAGKKVWRDYSLQHFFHSHLKHHHYRHHFDCLRCRLNFYSNHRHWLSIATALHPPIPLRTLMTGPELCPTFAPNCRRVFERVPLMQPCPTFQPPMPSRRPPSPARSCALSRPSSRAPLPTTIPQSPIEF
jgi:hypothetical protein